MKCKVEKIRRCWKCWYGYTTLSHMCLSVSYPTLGSLRQYPVTSFHATATSAFRCQSQSHRLSGGLIYSPMNTRNIVRSRKRSRLIRARRGKAYSLGRGQFSERGSTFSDRRKQLFTEIRWSVKYIRWSVWPTALLTLDYCSYELETWKWLARGILRTECQATQDMWGVSDFVPPPLLIAKKAKSSSRINSIKKS